MRQLCDWQLSAIIGNGRKESLAASDSLRLVFDLWRAHLHITGREMIARLITTPRRLITTTEEHRGGIGET